MRRERQPVARPRGRLAVPAGAVLRSAKISALGALLTGAVAGALPAAAAADNIIVQGSGACAEIEREPFRMRFFQGTCTLQDGSVSGTPVLEHVPNPGATLQIPVTTDPILQGAAMLPPEVVRDDVALYAPLVYEVGRPYPVPGALLQLPFDLTVGGQLLVTFPGTPWVGNMYLDTRSADAYAATRVRSSSVINSDIDGDGVVDQGVQLELETNEPAQPPLERLMLVSITRDGVNGLRVRATLNSLQNVITIGDSFVKRPTEAFRGFGGRHPGTNLNGRRFYSWVEQENLGGGFIQDRIVRAFIAAAIPPYVAYFLSLGYPAEVAQQLGTELGTQVGTKNGLEYMFPNGAMAAYYPQNLFVSSEDYGMLVANPEFTRWRLQNPGQWQVSVAVPWGDARLGVTADGTFQLDYTVAVGNDGAVISALTRINGKNSLPPLWAQGPTISRTVQLPGAKQNPANPADPMDLIPDPDYPGDTPATYWTKVQDDLANIEGFHLPVDAYAFEGWAVLTETQVKSVIARLKRRNIRAIAYVRPYFSDDGLLTQAPSDYAEIVSLGLVAKRVTPQGTLENYVWRGRNDAVLLDLDNQFAVRWLQARLVRMLDLGFDGFHSDFGEQVTQDMYFLTLSSTGSLISVESGQTMHNKYPVLLSKITRETLEAYRQQTGREIFFFSRGGYSAVNHCAPGATGIACTRLRGSAATDYANHPGDATTDWTISSGIGSQIPDMLNRGIGGNVGWNIDIGGYADFVRKNDDALEPSVYEGTTKELFIRWTQLAALTPYFRVHNSGLTGVRQPWSFDAETRNIWTAMALIHKAALPYIRRQWRTTLANGTPIMRPMWLAFPNDTTATNPPADVAWLLDQQYMLGNELLVAPVVTPLAVNQGKRRVYLPAGTWVDVNAKFFNAISPRNVPEERETYDLTAGTWVEVNADLKRLPVFVRRDSRLVTDLMGGLSTLPR